MIVFEDNVRNFLLTLISMEAENDESASTKTDESASRKKNQ